MLFFFFSWGFPANMHSLVGFFPLWQLLGLLGVLCDNSVYHGTLKNRANLVWHIWAYRILSLLQWKTLHTPNGLPISMQYRLGRRFTTEMVSVPSRRYLRQQLLSVIFCYNLHLNVNTSIRQVIVGPRPPLTDNIHFQFIYSLSKTHVLTCLLYSRFSVGVENIHCAVTLVKPLHPNIQTQRNSFLRPIPASALLFSRLHIKAECAKQLAGACCRLYLEQPSGPGPPLFWAWWGGNPARLRRVLIITLHLRQAAQPRAEPGWRRAADWQDKKMPRRRGRVL